MDNINEFAKQVNKFERENDDKTAVDFVNYINLLEVQVELRNLP